MAKPTAVITDESRTVPIARDLAGELAVLSKAILDKREQKTKAASKFTNEIKELEKKQREVITAIETGSSQMSLEFRERVGAAIEAAEKTAAAAPSDDSTPFDDEEDDDDTEKVMEH